MKSIIKRMLAMLIALLLSLPGTLSLPASAFAEDSADETVALEDLVIEDDTVSSLEIDSPVEEVGEIPLTDLSDTLSEDSASEDAPQPDPDAVVAYCFIRQRHRPGEGQDHHHRHRRQRQEGEGEDQSEVNRFSDRNGKDSSLRSE